MFDHTHYVPVLRWKQAEQHALRDLFPSVKSKLTPFIEAPVEAKTVSGTNSERRKMGQDSQSYNDRG